MRFRHYNIPTLIQNYFKTNFNLERFKDENEILIREYTIKNYVYTTPTNELYDVVLQMLSEYKVNKKKIRIDKDFPKDRLVEIMRPYLHLYYTKTHSLETYKRRDAMDLLEEKMENFIFRNPQFGRKIYKMHNNIFEKNKMEISFNDTHINFYENYESPLYNFMNSHMIEKEEVENIYQTRTSIFETYTNYTSSIFNPFQTDTSMNIILSFYPPEEQELHIHHYTSTTFE